MKWFMSAILMLLLTTSAQAVQVGVSVSIGQPGFYGQIDIGGAPPPQVVYVQPVVARPPPVVVQVEPLYLYVPQAHIKKWPKYCSRYNACGRPVYFVQPTYYQNVYVPYYHAHGHPQKAHYKAHKKAHKQEHRQDKRQDNRHGH